MQGGREGVRDSEGERERERASKGWVGGRGEGRILS